MNLRGTRSTIAVVTTLVTAALILTALVAVIGSAQAAPTKKVYDATVRVTPATSPAEASATLRLTLTNNNASTQTLGSANFTAPTGVKVTSVILQTTTPPTTTNRTGWTAQVQANGAYVAFRSTSNALPKTASVYADVVVDISKTTAPTCGDATWTAAAKQSNDFSGTGNDFTVGSSTNLRALGSLTIADIGTTVPDPDGVADPVFVPQVAIADPDGPAAVNVAAFDVCGAPYPKYGVSSTFGAGATVVRTGVPPDPPRLVHATIPAIAWSNATIGPTVGTGSTTLDPAAGEAETGDKLVLDDQFTDITGGSNIFDVVEKICTIFDDTCHWNNGNNKIRVDAAPPTDADASLGIGFIDDESFSCAGGTSALGGELIYINPRDYPATTEGQSVAITYDKTVPGTSGNVANFGSCISKDNGDSWTAISDCAHSPPVPADAAVVPCIQSRDRVQGNLVLTLFLNPNTDPLHGGR